MRETSAAAASARRRRLLFRATHRGTKEADLLVGGYIATHLQRFSDAELSIFEQVLELPDPLLADWLTGLRAIPDDHEFREALDRMRRHCSQQAETPR